MKKIILKIKNSDISILEYSDLSQLKDTFKKYNIIINKHCLIPDILTISPNIILGIGCKIGNDVTIGENVKIDDEVTVGNDVVIKDNVKIENGVTLSDSVIIESNNIIGEEAIIELGTILENSFYKKGIDSLLLPSTIKTIGRYGFRENNLTKLTLPNSVDTIGTLAFSNNSLTTDAGRSTTSPAAIWLASWGDKSCIGKGLPYEINYMNLWQNYM